MSRILHVATSNDWAKDSETYEHETLHSEGFIHACGSVEDLMFVWDNFIKGPGDYVLVELSKDTCSTEVKDDFVESLSKTFPHVYGKIVKAEVLRAAPFHNREELEKLVA